MWLLLAMSSIWLQHQAYQNTVLSKGALMPGRTMLALVQSHSSQSATLVYQCFWLVATLVKQQLASSRWPAEA